MVTSLLTAATIPLIKYSLEAISDAGELGTQRILTKEEVGALSKKIQRTPFEVAKELAELEQSRPGRADLSRSETFLLANGLKVDPAELEASLKELAKERLPVKGRPKGLEAVNRLGLLCLIVIGLYVAKYWFTRGVTYYLSRAANRLAADLRKRMFEKLQRLPISYFNEKRTGAIQSVLTYDVNVFQTAVTIIRDSIEGPVKMVGAAVAIAFLQWQLFVVALLLFPFMLVAIQRNAKRMKVAQRHVQEDLADVSAVTQESLQGTRLVRAFAAEEQVQASYDALVEKSFRSQMRAVSNLAALRPLVEFIGALGMAAVLYLCGWLAYRGSLQVADIAAIVIALDIVNQGFRNLASVNNTYATVQAAAARIYGEILDVPEEHVDARGTLTLPNPQGRVEFRNVSFSYPDGTKALDSVSFVIEPGSSLALVGPSGAGKSTIADLVLRFYDPTSGQIFFDDVDIRELDVSWLRRQIGVVPQQTFLFAGTIAENIRMGKPGATEDEVHAASKAAHADEFVSEMPEGYMTPLHERGVRLSGGQMQRVAIARALVRKPTMLLLDEATSALDAQSERKVQEALDDIMHQHTTLFIAHRLTTASRADRILVLRRGQVVEVGSHRELLERDSVYAGMVRAFGNGFLEGVA